MVTASRVIFDPAAGTQLTQSRVWIGGPRRKVAEIVGRQGFAINLGAYSYPAADFDAMSSTVTITGGSPGSFPVQGGAFYAKGSRDGDNWFEYAYRENYVLRGVVRKSGTDPVIRTTQGGQPNPLQLWRDVSRYLTKGRKGFRVAGSRYQWTMSLEGAQWNSLIVFQDAAVILEQRYSNSTSRQWSDWEPRFIGYLDPVNVSAGNNQNRFSVTATGQLKYLDAKLLPAQTLGCEQIQAVYSGSPILTNTDLAPDEGRPPQDFGYPNLGDDDNLTVSVLLDIPSPAPPLERPIGVMTANPPQEKWHYQKIQQVFCAGRTGPRLSRTQQFWFEVVNGMGSNAPNLWPWIDDAGTPNLSPKLPDGTPNPLYRPPIKAALSEAEWETLKGAGYNLGELAIEFWPSGKRVYLSKDGKTGVTLGPQQVARFVYDQKIHEENFRTAGATIIELKSLDGWAPGMWMQDRRQGVGASITPDPRAGGILIRAGAIPYAMVRSGANDWQQSTITADTASAATNWVGTVTLANAATFPERGEATVQNLNCTLMWNGKSGNTLLNVQKGGSDGQQKREPSQTVGGVLHVDTWRGWILDAVFWGDQTPPSIFSVETMDDDIDQNGRPAFEQVWVNRTNPNAATSSVPGATVAPTGIPENSSIRRRKWAGGMGDRRPDDAADVPPTFEAHTGWDYGTAADWEVISPPLPGNPAPLQTIAHFMLELPLHAAATVAVDDTDTPVSGVPMQQIAVNENGAWEYPPQLGEREYLLAGSCSWRYSRRDRSTFYGVRRLDANGAEIAPGSAQSIALAIPAGTEIQRMTDLNPDWRLGEHGPLSPRNLLSVAGLSWDHRKVQPTATVVADEISAAARVRVGPGQATRFPAAGTFKARDQSGARTMTFDYTSHDASTFFNVVWLGTEPLEGGPLTFGIPVGRTITGVAPTNYPLSWSIHASRRDDPIPFTTFYGSNPDWQEIVGNGRSTGTQEIVDIVGTGHNSQWRWIVLVIWEMSDGSYPALSHLKAWRQPKSVTGPVSVRAMLQGGSSYGDMIDAVLDQAGVDPEDRVIDRRGPFTRSLAIAQTNVGEACEDIAKRAGFLFGSNNLDQIEWRPDPRRPGARFPSRPVITLDKTTIVGTVQMEELPHLVMSQARLIAKNPYDQEVYDVTYPPQPYEFGGEPRIIEDRFAVSEQDAMYQARNELARANGGYRLTIPIGQFDDLEPFDLARVRLPEIDTARVKFDDTMVVVGGDWAFGRNGQTGSLMLETFKKD